jgi:hypothetical protein
MAVLSFGIRWKYQGISRVTVIGADFSRKLIIIVWNFLPCGKIPRQTDQGQSSARPGWLGQALPCECFYQPANGTDFSGFWCIIDLSYKVYDLQITIKKSIDGVFAEFVAPSTEFVEL